MTTIAWHRDPRSELRDLFELAEDSRDELDRYIEEGRVLVARNGDGKVVGHLQLVPTDRVDENEIKSLAVRDGFRRGGIGRQLVERALAECVADGIAQVTVTTAAADIDNLRFYQRCGFRPSSVQRDAFTPGNGYPPDLTVGGIALRDSISFTITLPPTAPAPEACPTDAEPMVTKGLIVRLEAKPGQEEELADFLCSALPLAQDEPQTIAWFALRSGPSSFAIVHAFPNDEGRREHLEGAIAAALIQKAKELLAEPPTIEYVDALAAKLP